MDRENASLDEFSGLAPREFVQAAYGRMLGRPPTPSEAERMLESLRRGDARTWLLGTLRYSAEGSVRGVLVPGLRPRYIAQRAFRITVLGPVLEWINAVVRLPLSLRYLRAIGQIEAEGNASAREREVGRIDELERWHERLEGQRGEMLAQLADLGRRHDETQRRGQEMLDGLADLGRRHDELRGEVRSVRSDAQAQAKKHLDGTAADRARIDRLEGEHRAATTATERLRDAQESLASSLQGVRARIERILPPDLGDTLEVRGDPLVALARERSGVAPGTPISSLTPHARYAMFETVFYESPAVAAKQRVYIPCLDVELSRRWPFLDLGCGRGEFLRILRGEGIASVGVDVNPIGLAPLRAEGFDVVERDLMAFLEADRRTYSGASLLQVVEHLTDEQIDRLLPLVAARLAPGGVFIVETPNPLSGFALGVFHTDPTHVRPLPPERMRYAIEAAGFEQARTLFQARIPRDQFAGPDPRAYYADYAIIASRSSS